jgi:hypothetical protein
MRDVKMSGLSLRGLTVIDLKALSSDGAFFILDLRLQISDYEEIRCFFMQKCKEK